MFNKIIKRGKKSAKSDAVEAGVFAYGSAGSSSQVTISHASRSAAPSQVSSNPNFQERGPSTAALGPIENLPSFREVSPSERPNLFLRKLQICSLSFDYSDTLKSAREKECKRLALTEIYEFLQFSGKLAEPLQEELIRMISLNVFRCLPPAAHENTGGENDAEEEEPYMDPTWTYRQVVYEILLRYIVSPDTDAKIAKRYIDHNFVTNILDLFDSEDLRERDFLKTILHRIYGKFMVYRPFIRKSISNIFYRFIFETEHHFGIGELLEVLGSIINGFALPMKEEHKLFLVRALIPLHKPKSAAFYHQPLSYCVTQFVEKDPKLAEIVIRGMLKYWPLTNCQKEVLFLAELEDVLEVTQSAEFQKCMVPLFRQIGRCLISSHFQVAERALFLWNSDHIVNLIAQNRAAILPLIFEALETNIAGHWNQAVYGLSGNVRKMFLDMDPELFEECRRMHVEKVTQAGARREQRELVWKRLEAVAAKSAADGMVLVN